MNINSFWLPIIFYKVDQFFGGYELLNLILINFIKKQILSKLSRISTRAFPLENPANQCKISKGNLLIKGI